MARLFFALWPDDEIRKEICNISNQFKDENIRLTKISNLHITLAFLGEVSEQAQQELEEKVSLIKIEPFNIELTRIGWWKKPQILWIGTTDIPKPLQQLVKSIKKCVKQQGLKIDQREYKPHVTIARKVKKVVIPKDTFKINWEVSSFVLVISESTNSGVDYQIIHK
jgi:RNA 2',3'-cyclic 3'-phosphodiesterase